MGQREPISDDLRILRRCVRDVVAFSALSAIWLSYDAERMAESLADVLLGMLHLDFIYVYVQRPPPDLPLEVARTEEGLDIAGQAALLGQALAPWLHGTGPHPPVSIGNPVGSGSVRIVSSSLGLGAEYGTAVAGSQRVDFPTETESLLLALGTNQAALMFARLRAEAAVQQAYTELEHRVHERTAALSREMAERRRLEQEAQRAQHFALLSRLAAGVSHEIRNPLSVIFLLVEPPPFVPQYFGEVRIEGSLGGHSVIGG
jgi:signal transduction histidine kinase